METFSSVDKNTAPFLGSLRDGDVLAPSGNIPRTSPRLNAFFAIFIVDGARFVLSVGINP
ncbi:uncharacterized protein METZ01_LOCUS80858 [marine metagenome]|uniref:Uncharacterized protein n=1 Tax=marine metagenome TaxID=408172 RepID=A0A381UJ59_9ZZZZ